VAEVERQADARPTADEEAVLISRAKKLKVTIAALGDVLNGDKRRIQSIEDAAIDQLTALMLLAPPAVDKEARAVVSAKRAGGAEAAKERLPETGESHASRTRHHRQLPGDTKVVFAANSSLFTLTHAAEIAPAFQHTQQDRWRSAKSPPTPVHWTPHVAATMGRSKQAPP
jgi:hypothetical protein